MERWGIAPRILCSPRPSSAVNGQPHGRPTLPLRKEPLQIRWIKGCVGPRASVDLIEKRYLPLGECRIKTLSRTSLYRIFAITKWSLVKVARFIVVWAYGAGYGVADLPAGGVVLRSEEQVLCKWQACAVSWQGTGNCIIWLCGNETRRYTVRRKGRKSVGI